MLLLLRWTTFGLCLAQFDSMASFDWLSLILLWLSPSYQWSHAKNSKGQQITALGLLLSSHVFRAKVRLVICQLWPPLFPTLSNLVGSKLMPLYVSSSSSLLPPIFYHITKHLQLAMMYGKAQENLFRRCWSFLQCTHQLDEHQVREHKHENISWKAWLPDCKIFYFYGLHYWCRDFLETTQSIFHGTFSLLSSWWSQWGTLWRMWWWSWKFPLQLLQLLGHVEEGYLTKAIKPSQLANVAQATTPTLDITICVVEYHELLKLQATNQLTSFVSTLTHSGYSIAFVS